MEKQVVCRQRAQLMGSEHLTSVHTALATGGASVKCAKHFLKLM
jgi:hypothetical protein